MARETWLMQENGLYEPGVPNDEARTGMLDFGNPEAREWVFEKLTQLIAESGVDHIKWDNNAWVNNTRPLAGAGPNDGNFRHVTGLYQVLAALKERFPWLLIENCSGGGNRLDLGLMRYTDAGWMDDRTSPSAHVRHNLQGLTTFLPPAYLLSYLLHDATEPMHDAADLALYARSRMPGVFGLSFPPDSLDERDIERVRARDGSLEGAARPAADRQRGAGLAAGPRHAVGPVGRHPARLAGHGSGRALRLPERRRGLRREHAPARARAHVRVRRRLRSRGRARGDDRRRAHRRRPRAVRGREHRRAPAHLHARDGRRGPRVPRQRPSGVLRPPH